MRMMKSMQRPTMNDAVKRAYNDYYVTLISMDGTSNWILYVTEADILPWKVPSWDGARCLHLFWAPAFQQEWPLRLSQQSWSPFSVGVGESAPGSAAIRDRGSVVSYRWEPRIFLENVIENRLPSPMRMVDMAVEITTPASKRERGDDVI